jgi:recombination protein RecA
MSTGLSLLKREKVSKTVKEELSKMDQLKLLIAKKFGSEAVSSVEDYLGEVLPTGCIAVDMATGIGGLPCGRITEVFGEEAGGKTTLALSTLDNAIKRASAYIDTEHALDFKWAKKMGVDFEKDVLLSQPDCLEDCFEIIETLIENGVKFIVLDTLAAAPIMAERDGDSGDHNTGQRPRIIGQFLRKITPILRREECTMLVLNQTRDVFGTGGKVGMPVQRQSADSKQLKFYASIRIQGKVSSQLGKGTGQAKISTATSTPFKIIKNKLANPGKTGTWVINYGVGFDNTEDYIKLAIGYGAIVRSGAWYQAQEDLIKLGYDGTKVNSIATFMDQIFNPGPYDKFVEYLQNRLAKEGLPFVEEEPQKEEDNSYEE